MAQPKNILLTAASGNIGKQLVPLLLSQDPQPKLILPTSDAQRLKIANPAVAQSSGKVVIEEGSIKDPVWFQSLLTSHEVDTIFLCVTGTDELFTSMNCVDAAQRVPTVKRLVYLSIIGDYTSEEGMKETIRTRGYPHLFAKVLLELKFKYAKHNFAWTVLGPTIFFENDCRQKASILEKSFLHEPLTEPPVNKIAVSDIALAARNAMYSINGDWSGKKIQLGTKTVFTGAEVRDLWIAAMNKPLESYFSTQEGMERFETQFRAMVPGDYGKAMARDIRILYEFLMEDGISITEEDYAQQVKLLGKEPEDYEKWVKATAASWLKERS